MSYPLASMWSESHNKDLPGAKFKIGDHVHVVHKYGYHAYAGGDGFVIGVSCISEYDGYEYAVSPFMSQLFWEDELTLIDQPV